MIAILSLLFSSSAFGSIIGIVGAWFTKKADNDTKKIDLEFERSKMAHALVMRDKDILFAKVELESKEKVAFSKDDADIESARMLAIAKSQEADALTAETLTAAGKHSTWLVFAEAWRRTIRPGLTTLYAGGAMLINVVLLYLLWSRWDEVPDAEQMTLIKMGLGWMLTQASAAGSFYFCVRSSSQETSK